jgi:hypothetical protein
MEEKGTDSQFQGHLRGVLPCSDHGYFFFLSHPGISVTEIWIFIEYYLAHTFQYSSETTDLDLHYIRNNTKRVRKNRQSKGGTS